MGGCPECGSGDLEMTRQDTDNQCYEYEEYSCNDCGCEFAWDMTRKILKHGVVEDEV